MDTTQDVQEVLNTLTNSITAGTVGSADDKAFAESFSAAIAQHDAAEREAAAAAVIAAATSVAAEVADATVAAAAAAAAVAATEPAAPEPVEVAPESTETNPETEHQHSNHEQLQRIADEHRQEIARQEKQEQEHQHQQHQHQHQEQGQEQSIAQAAVSEAEQHQQVLQHIATAAAEAGSTLATVPLTSAAAAPQAPVAKPIAGTEEWHKMRRDNHKEVERRRRETINDGINDLAKAVPNSEKNKGTILKQAVKYIQDLLAENEKLAREAELVTVSKFELDKYILEKSVADATYQSLNVQHEQLKRDYDELRKKMDELEPHVAKKQRVE